MLFAESIRFFSFQIRCFLFLSLSNFLAKMSMIWWDCYFALLLMLEVAQPFTSSGFPFTAKVNPFYKWFLKKNVLSWKSFNFVQCHFSTFIYVIIWFLLVWYITFIGLYMFNHPGSKNESPWSKWRFILIYYWIWLNNILLKIFKSVLIRGISL